MTPVIAAQLAVLYRLEERDLIAKSTHVEDDLHQYHELRFAQPALEALAAALGYDESVDPFEYRTCPRCCRAQHWSELTPVGVQWNHETGERLAMANSCCGGTFALPLSPVIVRRRATAGSRAEAA